MTKTIESDEDVKFIETGAKPDSLEQTVAGAAGNATGAASGVISCVDKVWDAYKSLCGIISGNIRPPISENYKDIVTGSLCMKYIQDTDKDWKIEFKLNRLLSPEEVLKVLVSNHGDYITNTDLWSKIKGVPHAQIPPEIISLFPELNELEQFQKSVCWTGYNSSNRMRTTLPNPYLLVLCATPKYRPFLAGCIELAEKDDAFADVGFGAQIDVSFVDYGKERLNKYLLPYAKQVGETDLYPILQELERIPVKEQE